MLGGDPPKMAGSEQRPSSARDPSVDARRAEVVRSYIRARRRVLEILQRLDREYEGWEEALTAEQYQAILDAEAESPAPAVEPAGPSEWHDRAS